MGSSKINNTGFFNNPLAIDILCLCPPDKFTPLSPTIVCIPFSNLFINSLEFDKSKAELISDSVAFGFAHIKFSYIDVLNKKTSWDITLVFSLKTEYLNLQDLHHRYEFLLYLEFVVLINKSTTVDLPDPDSPTNAVMEFFFTIRFSFSKTFLHYNN